VHDSFEIKEKCGFIDRTGVLVIGPQFGMTGNFSGGLARVWVGKTKIYSPHKRTTVIALGLKGREGYIDRTGEFASKKLTWKGKWKK
jgi:F0F1-type ATP synthase gamma subunit